MKTISGLFGKHKGEVLTVVGRGASLERLQLADLNGVVMAINQAIERVESLHPINPLYSLQKDHLYLYPNNATLLLHEAEALKEIETVDYEDAYSFHAERDFSVKWNMPSVVIAEKFANWFGCMNVVYLCCDAVTDGITDSYGPPALRPNDCLLHGDMVKANASLPVEWLKI